MSYPGLKRRYSTDLVVEYVQLMQSNQMKRGNKSVTLRTRNGPLSFAIDGRIDDEIDDEIDDGIDDEIAALAHGAH